MPKQLHLSQISLILFLGHITDPEAQQKTYDILHYPSMLSTRKTLFEKLSLRYYGLILHEYETDHSVSVHKRDPRSVKVIMSDFIEKVSANFYLAELHGGFELEKGVIKRKANSFQMFNMNHKSLKTETMSDWEERGAIHWHIEENERNYRELITYKLERENEIKAFTTTNPEFRSLERQIKELAAWQEAFADWFLDHGYELPEFASKAAQSTEGENPQVREESDKTNDVQIQVSRCYGIWTVANQKYNFTENQSKVMEALFEEYQFQPDKVCVSSTC